MHFPIDEQPTGLTDAELTGQLRTLYAEGSTLRELAQRFGFCEESIRRLMVANGIARRSRGQPAGKYLPNGGYTTDQDGYILIRMDRHPYANSTGYVREHRVVVEESLGRYLEPAEVVRHLDGNPANNNLDNLQLFVSDSEMKKLSLKGNSRAKGDLNNPKRSVRVTRSPYQILQCLRELDASLDRPIQRTDLQPPMPSYRAVARAFGSWQLGVLLALGERARSPKQ